MGAVEQECSKKDPLIKVDSNGHSFAKIAHSEYKQTIADTSCFHQQPSL